MRMDSINETRHKNLLALLEEAGNTKKLSDRTGVPAAYISQLKNRSLTAAGKPRNIGDETARQLESGMGKPPGWLDRADLSPYEREMLFTFGELSETGKAYALDWLRKLKAIDSSE